LEYENNKIELEKQLHQRAKTLLEQGKTNEAWMTLLAFND
jgi:hypothetical protein